MIDEAALTPSRRCRSLLPLTERGLEVLCGRWLLSVWAGMCCFFGAGGVASCLSEMGFLGASVAARLRGGIVMYIYIHRVSGGSLNGAWGYRCRFST